MFDKPLSSAILGIVGGSAAAAVVAFFTSSRVERQKFDYTIIQQALQADTQKEREARLTFLLEVGFIQDATLKERLSDKLKKKSDLPQLPATAISTTASPDASISDKGLISRFFSPLRNDRSVAFDEIVRRRTDDDVFLTQLMAEAKNHLADGDLVIVSLHILDRFSDSALLRARSAVEGHLNELDTLVKSQPGEWIETAKGVKDVRARLQKLRTQ